MEYSYYTEMQMRPNRLNEHKEEKSEIDSNHHTQSSDNDNDNKNNSGASSEISDGSMCRYCFCEVSEEENYSTCPCKTALCRECLKNYV